MTAGNVEIGRLSVGLYLIRPVAEILQVARTAEALGYGGVWFNDSQLTSRELYVALGAAVGATRSLRLGAGVTNLRTRHVSVVASALYTLDEMAPGRILAGIGRGELSVSRAGMPRSSYAELAASLGALRGLLAGRACQLDGSSASLAPAVQTPRGVPLLLSASGPRSILLAGAQGDGIILTSGAEPAAVRAAARLLSEGAAAALRGPHDHRLVVRVAYSSAEGMAARAAVAPHVALAALQTRSPLVPAALEADVASLRAGYSTGAHLQRDAAHNALVTDALVSAFALTGSGSALRGRLADLFDAGADEVCLVPMDDDIPAALARCADALEARAAPSGRPA